MAVGSSIADGILSVMDEHDLSDDPIVQLQVWLEEARATIPLAEAMTLATVGAGGRPSARVVLLRGIDERGLAFYTNRDSRKGDDLALNPVAALVIHWWDLGRQVRAEGAVEQVSAEESAAYWQSRPRASQLAAWASPQSRPLRDRAELDERFADVEDRFRAADVPLPTFWGGYRVVPDRFEFWLHRDNRLHDRFQYVRVDGPWRRERLAP